MTVDIDSMRAYVAKLRRQASQAPPEERIRMENTALAITKLIEEIIVSRQEDKENIKEN